VQGVTQAAFEPPAMPDVAVDADTRFDSVYREHFSDIYAYFLRRAPGDEVADLVSEVFLTVWRRLDQLPAPPEARLWLYGVARRVMTQHARTLGRRKRLIARIGREPATQQVTGVPEESPLATQVLDLVEHLPQKNREIVKLIVWERLSHSEAASVLGCSTNAVTIRWHRSLVYLRRKLQLSSGSSNPTQAGGI
jgi:RNA polymerase sigma-70 factor, ECF subfamily